MPIRENFSRESLYKDIDLMQSERRCKSIDDIRGEIRERDLFSLLDASEADEFARLAKKYAFFEASTASELSYDLGKSDAENRETADAQLAVNLIGYIDMQRHMNLAISLKSLCEQDVVSRSDLESVGFLIEPASLEDRTFSLQLETLIKDAKEKLQVDDLNPVLAECFDLQRRLGLPMFWCWERVTTSESPYAKHLRFGIKCNMDQDFWQVGLKVSKNPDDPHYIFDLGNDHFSEDAVGYREAVHKALDKLFRINLADVAVVTNAGIVEQKCRTVYAAFWYELARSLEGGRAMRCEACGKPLIAFGERGSKRKYCSDACRKWAQRNPGKRRRMQP